MKVILLQDVKAVGKKDDIVTVNDNYARNVLIAKGFGVVADSKGLNDLKLKKKNEDKIAAKQLQDAKDICAKIDRTEVNMTIKVGKDGKSFGSISTKEIASAINTKFGTSLDKKKIVLDENIKSTGIYEVVIKLHKDAQAIVILRITAEK